MYSHSSTCAGTSRGREFLTDCIELRVSQFAIKLLQSYLNIRKQIRTSRRLELLEQIYIWQSQKEISNKFDIFYFHKLKEMPNIRDYMNTHNITSSSRDSQEIRRPVNADYVNQRNITERYRDPITDNIGIIPPKYTNSDHLERIPLGSTTKYQKSKTQCIQQLTRILEDIDRNDLAMKRLVEEHNSGVLKKFSADYDNYAQQILRTVELHLKENKQRLLSQIKQRRGMEAAECKPIKRNMQKLKNEITSLREGLYRENEYRQYISKIVLRDYQHDLVQIQQDIKRLSLARVDLSIDEKYNSCFKNDLNKIIVVRDQLQSRIQEQYTYSPNYSKVEETPINSHLNRDQIKRVSSTQAPRNPV